MTGGAADFFEELRREYLAEAPSRLGELRKDVAAVLAGEGDAAASLKSRFHRLAGSGGSYGFPAISTAARAAEVWLTEHPQPLEQSDAAGQLDRMIREVAAAFDGAAAELGLPAGDPPGVGAFGWRAAVIGPDGGRGDAAEAVLRDAHYEVDRKPLDFDPAGIPVSERPNMVVIVADDPADAASLASRWAAPGARRPGVVVLLGACTIDSLAEPFARLDAVLAEDRFESDLAALARHLGRHATAPRSVLIVAPLESTVRTLTTAFEGAQIRTRQVASAATLRQLVGQESWDAIVTARRLPDADGAALIRWLRHQPGQRLTPIIVLTGQMDSGDRLTSIRAGADDVLPMEAPTQEILQTVIARIDRNRVIRSTAHRDEATGLLNEAALVEELDRAIGLARRSNEPVACLTFDIDHLRRINERHGQAVGDAVLLYVARALRSVIRSSDLTARVGGEEFSAVVRKCRPEDAGIVAEKVRAAVAAAPVVVAGLELTVRVSAGVACYPDHGANAAEVLRAANRALTAAKAAGRDRSAISVGS